LKKSLTFIFCFLIGVCFPVDCFAQNDNEDDSFVLKFYGHQSYPKPKPIINESRFVLPFKRAGNLILIEANIDGVYGEFIFDTGAPHLVLNKKYFPKAPMLASIEGAGITGGISTVIQSRVNEIDFGGLAYENVHVDLIDLTHLEDRKGERIFGLLGINLFSRFEVIIDYENATLTFHQLGKKGARIIEDSLTFFMDSLPAIELEISHKVIVVKGEINQKRLRFCLDTGAETNVVNANLSKKILDGIEITRKVNVSGTGSQKAEALLGNIKNLKIGSQEFSGLRTTVMNMNSISQVYGTTIDGMLGYDFLSQSKVAINFYKGEMKLW